MIIYAIIFKFLFVVHQIITKTIKILYFVYYLYIIDDNTVDIIISQYQIVIDFISKSME
jgi:hypothetical protein